MKTKIIKMKIISPLATYTISALALLFLWLVAPIDFIYKGDYASGLVLLSYFVIFYIGLFIGYRRFASTEMYVTPNISQIEKTTRILFYLGGIGLSIRIFERVFLRAGGTISGDFVANREMIASGGSGSIALIGAVLASILYFLPFFIFLLRTIGVKRKKYLFYFLISLMNPLFDVALQGSRSSLVMFVSVLLVSAITTKTIRLSFTKLIQGLIAAVALIWLSGSIFWARTIQMGIDPFTSMQDSGYAQFAPPSATVVSYFQQNSDSWFSGLFYSLINFAQYMLHGIYEFFYLTAN